jgi:hypothetical protein
MKKLLMTLAIIFMTTYAWADRAQYVPELIVTEPGSVWTDVRAFTSFNQALTDIGAVTQTTLVISKDVTGVTTDEVTSNITLKFTKGSVIIMAANQTLTISGPIQADPGEQIFDTSGASSYVVGSATTKVSVVYPEWWGAAGNAYSVVSPATGTDDSAELNAALRFYGAYGGSTTPYGGTVELLPNSRYLVDDNIFVPIGVTLKGHWKYGFGRGSVRAGGSSIVLDDGSGTHSIYLDSFSSVDGVIVVNANIEVYNYAYTTYPTWTGTGITLDGYGGVNEPESPNVTNSMIVGFQYGIKKASVAGSNGCTLTNLYMHNRNSIWLATINNPVFLRDLYLYGWGTSGSPAYGMGGDGYGIYIDDIDAFYLSDTFVRAYKYHVGIRGVSGNAWGAINNVLCEGNLEVIPTDPTWYSYGFVLGNPSGAAESVSVRVSNCQACVGATGTNSYNWYINSSSSPIITSCGGVGANYGFYTVGGSEPYMSNCYANNNLHNFATPSYAIDDTNYLTNDVNGYGDFYRQLVVRQSQFGGNAGINLIGGKASNYSNLGFSMINSADILVQGAVIGSTQTDNTSGSEDMSLYISTIAAGGALTPRVSVASTGETTFSKAIAGTPDSITATDAGVAASVSTLITLVTTNGDGDLDKVTLANGTIVGQIKIIVCQTEGAAGDTWKVTPATANGWTNIAFTTVGNGCILVWTAAGWTLAGNNGGTVS